MSNLNSRPEPKYTTNILSTTHPIHSGEKHLSDKGQYSQTCPFHSRLISNERITAGEHWQDVRLIRLDIKDSNIRCVNLSHLRILTSSHYDLADTKHCYLFKDTATIDTNT